jgi:hypothetical protein
VDTPTVAAHRLALTGPEWTLLCRRAGVRSPDGFGVVGEVPGREIAAAARTLSQRGILTGGTGDDGAVNQSVSANLAALAAPHALVQVELSVRGRGLRAAYAVRGQVGASLFTLPEGAVELSMFPAVGLGRELGRCVAPPPEQLAPGARIGAALAGPGAAASPPRGRLPLSALAEYAPTRAFAPPGALATALAVSDAEAALAAEVTRRTVGVLRCLVVSGASVSDMAGAVLAAEVVWLLTDAGWVGLRPQPDGSGRQLVDLVPVPVGQAEIGSWLAPYLARILEVVNDRTVDN